MSSVRKIGVLTGGGDAPGLNAVIRAVVKAACNANIQVIGLEDSFDGLLDPSRTRPLTPQDVTGILRLGGTILGTTNNGNPFEYPADTPEGMVDYSDRVVETFHNMKLDALVAIGGDGTLGIAHQFFLKGIPIVGVPKTIDNDIVGTTTCFGFDTAVAFAADAIDRLHSTAEAHKRVMVVEVMGRYAGWIALHAGVAGGADVILIPEIPYRMEKVAEHILAARGAGREVQHRRRSGGGEATRWGSGAARSGAGRACGATRWHRRPGGDRTGANDREAGALCRARAPPARRHADGLRSRAGDAAGRQGR